MLQCSTIDVNARNISDETPLYAAAENGWKEIIGLFIRHPKIDLNAKNKDGLTPLYIAAHWNDREIVEILAQQSGINIEFALHTARIKGDQKALKLLEEYGS